MAKHRSEIFKLSEEYFDKYLEFDTLTGLYVCDKDNIGNHLHWNHFGFPDKDPFISYPKRFKKKLEAAEPIDHYDELARENILYDIDDYLKDQDDHFYYGYWGSLFSDPESIYEVFKEMPKDTPKDILEIRKKMDKVPNVLIEWISALKDVYTKHGIVNAKIRVQYTIDVVDSIANGRWTKFAKSISENNEKLFESARKAELAYEQLSSWLSTVYMEIAKDDWRVGEQRYIKMANYFCGATIDPKEIYEWGYKELEEINKQMWEVAKQIKPNAKKLIEIRDHLNNDPKYVVEGAENFKNYLQNIIDITAKKLHGTVFDIPLAARNCIVVLDYDTIDESPFYYMPSDDLSKPGRTIYPVVGRTKFTTWENYSTWFHESIPGHHMQFVTAILNKKTLSKWQRTLGNTSGYAEGWALYSERLMDELGYFDDAGYKMGYLMCQAMRAARMVVDIGLHLGYKDPSGKIWTPESAAKFMEERALLQEDYAINEIKRYISWAGQAISYKVGEKVWIDSRKDAEQRLGDKFDLKKFHMYALRLGPMTLDTLRYELSQWNGK